MRAPSRAKKAETEAEKPTRYWLTDPNATEIAGRRLTPQERKDGVLLTASEAAHYIASGSVTDADPAKDAAAKDAVKRKTQGGAVGGVGHGATAGSKDATPVGPAI